MNGLEHLAAAVKRRLEADRPAGFLARRRCQDVHAVRWDVPDVLYDVMQPCESCKGWGTRVAAELAALPVAGSAAEFTLRAGVRRVLRECLTRRDHWARSNLDGAVARAVAYQSIAGMLHRALDEAPPSPADGGARST